MAEFVSIIQQIPGPRFLFYFALYMLACIIVGRILISIDRSTEHSLPELTQFGPLEISVLRKGWKGAVEVAYFKLVKKKLVKIVGTGGNARVITSTLSAVSKKDPILREVYVFLHTPKLAKGINQKRKVHELYHSRYLRKRIEPKLANTYKALEKFHLKRSRKYYLLSWMITLLTTLLIGSVGFTKLYLGIMRGRPVLYLVALLIFSFIMLFAVLRPNAIQTQLGRRYVRALKKHFRWIERPSKENDFPIGITPSLATAIFGVGLLSSTGIFLVGFSDRFIGFLKGATIFKYLVIIP